MVQQFMKRLNNFRQFIVYTEPPEEDKEASNNQLISNLSMIISNKEQLPKPVEPLKSETKENAIYEKLGDKTTSDLVENLLSAALDHPELCPYIQHITVDPVEFGVWKERKKQYLKYLLGGQDFWIGQPIFRAHQKLKIKDEHFDIYYRMLLIELKRVKLPVKTLQVIAKKLNDLRCQIVYQGGEIMESPIVPQ